MFEADGFDLNGRLGCDLFPAGLIAGPLFPLVVFAFLELMRRRRRKLAENLPPSVAEGWHPNQHGMALFTTWADCIPPPPPENSSSIASNGDCS